MPKIGVVLSGCASKGAYEIGCLAAIDDYFGPGAITCVSSSSIGGMIGQLYGMGRKEGLIQAFRDMDSGKYGRYILGFTNNKLAMQELEVLLQPPYQMAYEHYVTLWNYTASGVEYKPFHALTPEQLPAYMRAAMCFPVFSRGLVIDGQRYLDGAVLDNIPVHPLKDKALDCIFCIYFDNSQYRFEDAEFDRKVIKLHDFPNQERLEVLFCDPGSYDKMYAYGYDYTTKLLQKLFADPEREAVYAAITHHNATCEPAYKHRLTADVVLSGINTMTKKYSLSTREKVKAK